VVLLDHQVQADHQEQVDLLDPVAKMVLLDLADRTDLLDLVDKMDRQVAPAQVDHQDLAGKTEYPQVKRTTSTKVRIVMFQGIRYYPQNHQPQ
jgi:hypothetical protein